MKFISYFSCIETSLQAALLKEDENSVRSSNDKGARILSGKSSLSLAQIL